MPPATEGAQSTPRSPSFAADPAASLARVTQTAARRRRTTVSAKPLLLLPNPSTADFDRIYDASNPALCSSSTGAGQPCNVPNSHVANAVLHR
jgi:hypothetical protein